MQVNSILYIACSDTAITILIVLVFLFWNRRRAAGARYMALMMCSAAFWGLCNFLSDLSRSHTAKIYWDYISYLGIVIIPVAWLAFVMQYTKYEKFLIRGNIIILLIIPSITLLMLLTNNFHHLMIDEINFVKTEQMTVLSTTFGSWFWIHAAYSYLLFLLGIIILVKKLVHLPKILRSHSIIILAAILIPLVFNILYTFRMCPSYPIDMTIFSFSVTGILCFLGMFRYKLFDLIPAARNAVVEGMSGILVVVDNQNHIIDINPAAMKILSGSEKDFIGKCLFDILNEWSSYFIKYKDVLNVEEKFTLNIKNGVKHFDLRIAPLFDNKNKVVGRFFTLYETTALEEAISHLEDARKAAEDANKTKSRFLATMSHEIRTPLNGIIGMTELLISANHTEEEKVYLKSIQSCAGSLLDIVNDVLDFSKIEAGKMELEKTGFSLNNLIDATVKTFSHQIKERDIAFVYNIDPSIPENLVGDPVKIKQILVNLIGNAFKFTESGRIEVSVNLLKYENQQVFVQFSISDTGIGVPDDKIACLFESFQQADSSTTRKYGGTGLGLAIVKNLVTLMNGCIEVESKLDDGSRFFFTIPFNVSENEASKHIPASEIDFCNRGISILLAEDNKVNQMLISKLLEKKKIQVDIAVDGKAALNMLEKKAYTLIFMDIQMPEMDGYEATRAIRRNELNTGNHIPIIALTANASEADRNICLQSGMDDFLTKPIKTEELYEYIYKYSDSTLSGFKELVSQEG